ncbi:hypothetical protein [Ancylomarina sp. 16SWW S1-10-2]|uniref:hypothetical protein n=1 Tax=Ancylomarina sp. 16SWW S1-10-2 TaxID=2499681 RepID=UPI0012AE09B1|nr:hypothetical protein [Ancylomarina sp. 16SWW S1-10-2]MRT93538.1 hypothetical protein [Ancylomarina sp. 16SWW S1-10-2]
MKSCLLLNIQFSFGENYYDADPSSLWVSLLITLIGAAFGAWFGFKFYIKQEQTLREKRLESENRYFVKNLEDALENIKQQQKQYIESFEKQKNDLYHYSKPARLCFKNLTYLSKLNTHHLLESFSKKKNFDSNLFFDFFKSIDYVEDILKSVEISDFDNQHQYFNNIDSIEANRIDLITSLKQRGTYLNNNNLTTSKEFIFIHKLIEIDNRINEKFTLSSGHDFKSIKEVLIRKIKNNTTADFTSSTLWKDIDIKSQIISRYIGKIKANNKVANDMLNNNIIKITEELNFIEAVKSNVL